LKDLSADYEQKIDNLNEKLKQSENMANLYKEFINKRRLNIDEYDENNYCINQSRNKF
jgi:hypothetical protein